MIYTWRFTLLAFFSPENASFLAVMLTACHRPLPCSQITISYCADFPDRH